MEKELITIYVVADEVLKSIGYVDDHQAQMSTAEVITFAIGSGGCVAQIPRFTSHRLFNAYFRETFQPYSAEYALDVSRKYAPKNSARCEWVIYATQPLRPVFRWKPPKSPALFSIR